MKKPYKVFVEKRCTSWFVLYVDRALRRTRTCACFNAREHTRESIDKFISQNPKLELCASRKLPCV